MSVAYSDKCEGILPSEFCECFHVGLLYVWTHALDVEKMSSLRRG